MKLKKDYLQLKKIATQIRIESLKMIHTAGSGHPGGCLSITDFLSVLYFYGIDVNEKNPLLPTRDRFVLSKGHSAPALYATLALRGFFSIDELSTLRQECSSLQGHPNFQCPGIDLPTGSLGLGFAGAVGIALAAKVDNLPYNVYTAVGDGELQEGIIWEACNTASKYHLTNLIVFVDNNHIQLDGFTEEIMPNGDLVDKFSAFGFEVFHIDGNDIQQLINCFEILSISKSYKPKVIIGETIKGKGVSFMENNPRWHGIAPNADELQIAIKELTNNDSN